MDFNDQDWDLERVGDTIQDIIDRAVSSQNYHRLNKTVSDTVNRAINTGFDVAQRAKQSVYAQQYHVIRPAGTPKKKSLPAFYRETTPAMLSGIFKCLGGSLLTAIGIIWLLGISALSLFTGFHLLSFRTIFVLLTLIGGTTLISSGVKDFTLMNRYERYIKTLDGKTYCTLRALSQSTKKPINFVEKDVKKLIEKGYFLEGHIDETSKTLITSEETFQHYRKAIAAQKEKERQEQERAKRHDPRVKEVLDRGNSFIREIHRCNDIIPGEEISRKISRMETLVQRIFERAESHPEVVPELKKLMDYYLPMTIKLLHAYADMDAQPIQSQTMQASKREIENTLDTLNLAFEKLLDSIFKDTAMDVASDISVLQTLLAQEGLTEDGLHKTK